MAQCLVICRNLRRACEGAADRIPVIRAMRFVEFRLYQRLRQMTSRAVQMGMQLGITLFGVAPKVARR